MISVRKENTTLSIIKGIAIILMVAGHAEGPEFMTNFIYTFHMPVFFIAAGYFFTQKQIDAPWEFCVKRVKSLYLPFIFWSILFLVMHNMFFKIGLLNEMYGNWTGGVTHPYTLDIALKRLTLIIFSMGGYDEFLLGAFWFFRALLVVSITYLIFHKTISSNHKQYSNHKIAAIIIIIALLFAIVKIYFGLRIVTLIQGGIRETWGIIFFATGIIFRQYENKLPRNVICALIAFIIICIAAYFHCAGMNLSPKLIDVATLPVTGVTGFIMLYYISAIIDHKQNIIRKALVYIGNNTMPIFILHIISFKIVSLIKIAYYGLDIQQIGCHMVIHSPKDNFWILYTIAGVAIPLLLNHLYRKSCQISNL